MDEHTKLNSIRFVSLGPGDPELITVKGLKALQEADCIFCPETVTRQGEGLSRAADIMLELGIDSRHFYRFSLPMDKRREKALEAYDKVCVEAANLWKKGLKVCLVAEGDAGLYSSVHYVYEKLDSEGIPVEHIAGIPAFIAAGACGGLHIVSQEERLMVVPGVVTADEIGNFVGNGHAVVIMKLSRCKEEIKRCLQLHPEYDYHYFENVGLPNEVCLQETEQIETAAFPYFSVLIVRPKAS